MKPGLAPSQDNDDDKLDMEDAVHKLEVYVEDHPDFMTAVVFWVLTGNVLLVVGLVVFLYSEIKAVCLVRSHETRRKLLETQPLTPTSGDKDATEEERNFLAARPYLTFVATCLFFFGFLLAMIPLCDVLHLLGLPTGVACIYIITLEAFALALVATLFLLGLVWSCTRPWAAALLLSLALGGIVLCPTGNVLLVMVFLASSLAVYLLYFHWYPQYLEDQHVARPSWLQSIGSLEVDLTSHEAWLQSGRAMAGSWDEAQSLLGAPSGGDKSDKAV